MREIDFQSGAFFVEDAREAYRWLRERAPVYFDAKNGLWGIATYDSVRAAGSDWVPDIALENGEPLRRSITGINEMPVVFSPAPTM